MLLVSGHVSLRLGDGPIWEDLERMLTGRVGANFVYAQNEKQ